MILGEIPGLALDRSGIALLGAIAIVAGGRLSLDEAWLAVDISTIALLFGLMVVSAQFRLGGFYSEVVRRIAEHTAGPERLLGSVILASGVLSAVLTNDVVCLAMAPMLVEACVRRGLTPLPYLLALACAANVGSAATLIGNPQIMLIGQSLQLSFAGYLMDGAPPAVAARSGCVCRRRRAAVEPPDGLTRDARPRRLAPARALRGPLRPE
jgi:Na+/H+ antiporter NhaD/arsenite permease-like protein